MGGKKEGKIVAINEYKEGKRVSRKMIWNFIHWNGKGKDDEENGEEKTEEK